MVRSCEKVSHISSLVLFSFLLIITSSCNNNPKIQIQFNHAGGLTTESSVFLNGLRIGEVENMELNADNNKIIVEVELEKHLPIDSKFYIGKNGLLGGAILEVKAGKSTELIAGGESIIGEDRNSSAEFDTIGIKTLNLLKTILSSPAKEDSLRLELRRLNDNLEKLNLVKP